MRKICTFLLCTSILCVCVSACDVKRNDSMVKSQRRFAKYMEPSKDKQSGVIDLSEGPRLIYDATFGPKALDFDFKIKNPY